MLKATLHIPHSIPLPKASRLNFHVKKKAKLPQSWRELRLKHYRPLHEFRTDRQLGITEPYILGLLYCRWAGIPEAYSASPSVCFAPQFLDIIATFQKPPLHEKPLLKRFGLWRGPSHSLENICYEQFIYAEQCYAAWQASDSDEDLNALIGLTFRATWLPWSKRNAYLRQYIVQLLPKGLRLKMAYTFAGQRNKLPKLYPSLYSGSGSSQKLKIDQMILRQGGNDLTKYNAIRKMPCNLVLENMEDLEKQHREQKRKADELKKRSK